MSTKKRALNSIRNKRISARSELSAYQQIESQQASYRTTNDLFQRCLHRYTITHAIEDRNVLRFHVDYFKPEGKNLPKSGEALAKAKVIETILAKHDAATSGRKFNALLATASVNEAIEYFEAFKTIQTKREEEDNTFQLLNIACVFSPPAEGDQDIQQIQEDLPQEKADNQQDPKGKKAALIRIINDYNAHFGTHHRIVDKNLKHHGLIQAFSRTNRVLNDSKPYGNILDFRQQQTLVEEAIALFSGEKIDNPREIWLVDSAPKVIDSLQAATQKLANFMQSQDLEAKPEAVTNLKGDAARSQFINLFKEVQRLKTQLDQYTDLNEGQKTQIDQIVPPEQLQGFRSAYLETAKRLKEQQNRDQTLPEVRDLDFEFVLFASAMIDYDYIMALIARMTQQPPDKMTMNRQQLIGLIQSDAKFLDEGEDIADYIHSLPVGQALDEKQLRADYEVFKAGKKPVNLTLLPVSTI